MSDPDAPPPPHQPIFNIPDIVVFLIAILAGIHFVCDNLLSYPVYNEILLLFAFIPARITDPGMLAGFLPGGEGAAIWSFLTYAALHADWSHLGINCLGLAAFGTPVARRFGAGRFLLFSAVGAVAGAVLHLVIHPNDVTPLVGASAAISAHVAGAGRFAFSSGGPLRNAGGLEAYRRPAQPLLILLQDSRVVTFVAVWFGVNLVFGLLGPDGGLASGAIAWEAHVGGFVAGLLLFPLFDPVPVAAPIDKA